MNRPSRPTYNYGDTVIEQLVLCELGDVKVFLFAVLRHCKDRCLKRRSYKKKLARDSRLMCLFAWAPL